MNQEIYEKLSQPFEPSQVEWLIKSKRNGKALALPYADPRLYYKRLDEIVFSNWADKIEIYATTERLVAVCHLTIDGITRSSTGECPLTEIRASGEIETEQNSVTIAEAQAFKRASAKFGLGRYFYFFPKIYEELTPDGKEFTPQALERLRVFLETGVKQGVPTPAPRPQAAPAPRQQAVPQPVASLADENAVPPFEQETSGDIVTRKGIVIKNLTCPICGAGVWDNRKTKTGRQPDVKCKANGDHAFWVD